MLKTTVPFNSPVSSASVSVTPDCPSRLPCHIPIQFSLLMGSAMAETPSAINNPAKAIILRFIAIPPSLLLFGHDDSGERAAESHGFNGGRRHNHHGALFSYGFKEHVHSAQVQRAGGVVIYARGPGELIGDAHFCFAENHARLALALGLGLLGHRIFECLRDANIANLDGLHGDSPGIRFDIEDALKPW